MTQLTTLTGAPQLLSHQTGLSVLISTANTNYNIGNSISIPRNGLLAIEIAGHVQYGTAYFNINITRGTTTYSTYNYNTDSSDFDILLFNGLISVLGGDIVQLTTTNGTAGYSNYIDDLVVILQ